MITTALGLVAVLLIAGSSADNCPAQKRTVSKVVGGKTISQELVQLPLAMGRCAFVLAGSKSKDWRTESCVRCYGENKDSLRCTGPSQKQTSKSGCQMALGPDCKFYLADGQDATKPCSPQSPPSLKVPAAAAQNCPAQKRTVSKVVGGQTVSQELVQLPLAMGRCAFVLAGSESKDWRTESCARCYGENKDSIRCTGPSQQQTSKSGCQMALGPDCKFYLADGQDATKPCSPQSPPVLMVPGMGGDDDSYDDVDYDF